MSAPPLTDLYVYVTDGCNCSCRHCWIVPERRVGPARFIDPGVLEQAIVEGLPLGLQSVKWTGGEPTIHPRFRDLLEIQRRHGLDGRVETNGIEVTPSLAAAMHDSGVSHVAVSLDGAEPATHDAVRGVAGAHDRALRGVAALVDAGFEPQLIMTLMAGNLDEVPAMTDLARTLGAGSLKFNILQPTLRGEELHNAGVGVGLRDLLSLAARLQDDAASRPSLPIYLDLPAALRPFSQILDEGVRDTCGVLTIIGLLSSGHYALCGIGQEMPELVFGAVGRDDLEEIWEGHPTLLSLREGLPDRLTGVCGRCALRSACLGSCIAQNYYRRGDLFAPYWLCEEALHEGLFPEARLRPGARGDTVT